MLLDIIILVLRETIEAGILISVLLSVARQQEMGSGWLWTGLFLGAFLATTYAINFNQVSELFDYAGQEVFNATLQLFIYSCLLTIAISLISNTTRKHLRFWQTIMLFTVCLAITRELTEMVIFYTGYLQSNGDLLQAATSGFVGLMIGSSFGAISYYAIISWRPEVAKVIQFSLLTLISAGMAVQAIQLLMQIDWISSSKPLWDSNYLLPESSAIGQITYAVFGYEATPTLIEVCAYTATIIIMGLILFLSRYSLLRHTKKGRV